MKNCRKRHKNVAQYKLGNTKNLYFFNYLSEGRISSNEHPPLFCKNCLPLHQHTV